MQHRFTEKHLKQLQSLSKILDRPPYLVEFAKITGIPEITCYKWAELRRLPAVKTGGRWVMDMKGLETWQPPIAKTHKLNIRKAKAIRLAVKAGTPQEVLAEEHGVDEEIIENIVEGRTYVET